MDGNENYFCVLFLPSSIFTFLASIFLDPSSSRNCSLLCTRPCQVRNNKNDNLHGRLEARIVQTKSTAISFCNCRDNLPNWSINQLIYNYNIREKRRYHLRESSNLAPHDVYDVLPYSSKNYYISCTILYFVFNI